LEHGSNFQALQNILSGLAGCVVILQVWPSIYNTSDIFNRNLAVATKTCL